MRWLYAIIGAVWGGLLGIFASFLIYLFAHFALSLLGGETLPPAWVLITIKGFSAFGFLVMFVSAIAAGWRIGTIIDLDVNADKVKARERALNYFVAAVIANAIFVGGLGFYAEKQAQNALIDGPPENRLPSASIQAPAYAKVLHALEATLHDITAINTADAGINNADQRFINVEVMLEGTRHGKYRIEAELSDRVHNALLVRRHKSFVATPGAQSVRLTFDRDEIQDAYLQKVLSGSPPAQAMDMMSDFRLFIRLVPELTAEEKDKLPDFIMQSMLLGKSALIRDKETSLRLGLKFQ